MFSGMIWDYCANRGERVNANACTGTTIPNTRLQFCCQFLAQDFRRFFLLRGYGLYWQLLRNNFNTIERLGNDLLLRLFLCTQQRKKHQLRVQAVANERKKGITKGSVLVRISAMRWKRNRGRNKRRETFGKENWGYKNSSCGNILTSTLDFRVVLLKQSRRANPQTASKLGYTTPTASRVVNHMDPRVRCVQSLIICTVSCQPPFR